MNLCLLLMAFVLMAAGVQSAGAVSLEWGPVPNVQGYRVYYGRWSGQYQTVVDAGPATTAVISGLDSGLEFFFAVTAYAAGGESLYSNEVSTVIPTVAVDDIPPSVVITSPSEGDEFNLTRTVQIRVSAGDNVGVTAVQIRVDKEPLCTETSAPYACQWKGPRTHGSHTIEATAWDAAGKHQDSAIVQVIAR